MTDNIVIVIGAVLASEGLWKVIDELIKTRKKKRTPQEELLLAIGREKLLTLCKHYEEEGHIPADEYESFEKLGNAYINMGGNSTVKKLFQQCMKLEVNQVEEEVKDTN